MELEVWSDIACPWCYIGKRRLERALAEFEHADELTITWRSFELDPQAPPEREGELAGHLARKYGMPIEQARIRSGPVDRDGRRRGAGFPSRPGAQRQHL